MKIVSIAAAYSPAQEDSVLFGLSDTGVLYRLILGKTGLCWEKVEVSFLQTDQTEKQ